MPAVLGGHIEQTLARPVTDTSMQLQVQFEAVVIQMRQVGIIRSRGACRGTLALCQLQNQHRHNLWQCHAAAGFCRFLVT